jgi:hypothetical protein
MMRKLTAAALAASVALVTTSASAQGSRAEHAREFADADGWSVAGLLGFGFSSYAGFGFGVRGGYTLPSHVYLGGTFVDYLGFGGYGNSFLTGFEAGYNIKAGPVVVRPYGALGLVDITISNYYSGVNTNAICGVNGYACNSLSAVYAALWIGGTVMYPITDNWFVGGDLRFLLTPGFGATAVTGALMGTGGYQF